MPKGMTENELKQLGICCAACLCVVVCVCCVLCNCLHSISPIEIKCELHSMKGTEKTQNAKQKQPDCAQFVKIQ